MRTPHLDSFSCPREPEVRDAISAGRWPLRAEPELVAHARQCAVCEDLADVSAALREDQSEAWAGAVLPDAHVVWLRAQLRARTEAAELASRPITVVQAIGVACALGAAAGVVGASAWWLRSWVAWLNAAATVAAGAPGGMDVIGLAVRGALLAMAVWLVLAPVAVYLAATED